jgi:hypothetical protein
MLMSSETALQGRVEGTSSFASEFMKKGLRDKKGRSLRDLDLKHRLFTYPCSYLIYSKAFDDLPVPVKDRIFLRLWEVLTGKDTSKEFAYLPQTIGTPSWKSWQRPKRICRRIGKRPNSDLQLEQPRHPTRQRGLGHCTR